VPSASCSDFTPGPGAWLLIAFLVPVTFTMHAFWTVSDPAMHAIQLANFMKNISLIGASLMLAYWGAGRGAWT
jgi:uncharacterized membrane protein YphA (DoxX/SURF4 family)